MLIERPTPEQLKALAEAQKKCALSRFTLHKFGCVLRCVGIGMVGAVLIQLFYVHQKMSVLHWFVGGVGVFTLILTSVIIPYNRRFMIAHATAHDGMMGLLNSTPGSSELILHLDQAQAALDELAMLYGKMAKRRERFRLFKKKS